MSKSIISTKEAPEAIGPYSQAVRAGDFVYMSGQIPLNPETMQVETEDFAEQTKQVFKNIDAVARATGGTMKNIIKLNVYVTDLGNFPILNDIMAEYVDEPYPARAAVEVSALPKGVQVEIEAVMYLG